MVLERFKDVRPQRVARCATPEEVAAALAGRSELPLAVRAGGHCFEGRSSTRGLLIDVSPMNAISVGDGTVTVGAGTLQGDVYDTLTAQGRTFAGGCGPTVAITGLLLGGGIGLIGRRHGLACDQLLSAQVVLADGRVVRCDAEHEPDLFWALRGAGGCRFGVVTELTLRTVPAREETCCELRYPAEAAAEVIDAWQRWDAPDEVAVSALVTAPADPGLPPVVRVFGIADAVELPEPESATYTRMPYRELKRHLADDDPAGAWKPDPGLMYAKSHFFREPLARETIDALVAHLAQDRVPGQSRELDFSPFGGGYARVPGDATAFPHRDARVLLKHEVVAEADPDRAWLAESWALAQGFGAYVNFPDADLDFWDHAYHGANLERLLQVRARYDPDGVFDAPHGLGGRITSGR
jgi:FAD/FMN-containing dehydrogenase